MWSRAKIAGKFQKKKRKISGTANAVSNGPSDCTKAESTARNEDAKRWNVGLGTLLSMIDVARRRMGEGA